MEKILILKVYSTHPQTDRIQIVYQSKKIKRGQGAIIRNDCILIASNTYPALYSSDIYTQLIIKGVDRNMDNNRISFKDRLRVFNQLDTIDGDIIDTKSKL